MNITRTLAAAAPSAHPHLEHPRISWTLRLHQDHLPQCLSTVYTWARRIGPVTLPKQPTTR